MKKVVFIVIGLAVGSSLADPCDATYSLKGGRQYIREARLIGTEQVVSQQTTLFDQHLAGVTILDTSIVYTTVAGFKGECGTPVQTPVTFRTRAKTGTSYSDATRSNLWFEMFDSTVYQLGGSGFDWWYAFGPVLDNGHVRVDTAEYVVGHRAVDTFFGSWYGTAVLIDSAKQSSGLWQVVQWRYPLYPDYDSARVDSSLLADWRAMPWDGTTRKGHYKLQLLRVEFDTTTAAVRSDPGRRSQWAAALAGGAARESEIFDLCGRSVLRLPSGISAAPNAASGYYIVRQESPGKAIRVGEISVGR